MAEVRFLFTTVRVVTYRYQPVRSRTQAGVTPTRWRLLGRNNRELGRSEQVFLNQTTCRDAVVVLKRQLGKARAAFARDAHGGWTWRLYLHGVPVATVGRSYTRHRECLTNLRQFLAAVPQAGYAAASGPQPSPDIAGPDLAGPGIAGPGIAGPDFGGPGIAGPDLAGPGIAGPDFSGPDFGGAGIGGPGIGGPDFGGHEVAGSGFDRSRPGPPRAAADSALDRRAYAVAELR